MTRRNNRGQSRTFYRGNLQDGLQPSFSGDPFSITRQPIADSLDKQIWSIRGLLKSFQGGVGANLDPRGFILATEEEVRFTHKRSDISYGNLREELLNGMGGTSLRELVVPISTALLNDKRDGIIFGTSSKTVLQERDKASALMKRLAGQSIGRQINTFAGVYFSKPLGPQAKEALQPALQALIGAEVTLQKAEPVPAA